MTIYRDPTEQSQERTAGIGQKYMVSLCARYRMVRSGWAPWCLCLGQGRVRFGTQRSDFKSAQTAPAQGQGPLETGSGFSRSGAPSPPTGQAGPASSLPRPGYRLHVGALLSKRPFQTNDYLEPSADSAPGARRLCTPRSTFALLQALRCVCGSFQNRVFPKSERIRGLPGPRARHPTDQEHSRGKPVIPEK